MSKKLFFTYCLFLLITGFAKEGEELEVKVVKWEDGLIIPPGITKEVGDNVQGPVSYTHQTLPTSDLV